MLNISSPPTLSTHLIRALSLCISLPFMYRCLQQQWDEGFQWMHLRENAVDGVGKRRDFYPLLLNRVLSNEKRRRKKLKGKAGDLFCCTGDAVNTGGGPGWRGEGELSSQEKEKKRTKWKEGGCHSRSQNPTHTTANEMLVKTWNTFYSNANENCWNVRQKKME